MRNKLAPLEIGDTVKWLIKVHIDLGYETRVPAEIIALDDVTALIQVSKCDDPDSPKLQFTVPRSRLVNTRWIEDEQTIEELEKEWFVNAEIIDAKDWEDGFAPPAPAEAIVYETVEDYLETCEDESIRPSKYLWCNTSTEPVKIDAHNFVEALIEDFGEECMPELEGLEELQLAINTFYGRNDLVVNKLNYQKAVMVFR